MNKVNRIWKFETAHGGEHYIGEDALETITLAVQKEINETTSPAAIRRLGFSLPKKCYE